MKLLVTGAKGFVGRNLVAALENIRDGKDAASPLPADLAIYAYDVDSDPGLLDRYCADCDFVFHLAGVNRPQDPAEFMQGNFGFASQLLDTLKKHKNTCPVLLSSSTQAALANPYGESKKAGEALFFDYAEETGVRVYVYRFPNVFGKWCRPNYNSAVATFCHHIARGEPIAVRDRAHEMTLVYIDDVVQELLRAAAGEPTADGRFCRVPVEHHTTLGEIVDLLYSFRESRRTLAVPDMTDGSLSKKLYATYLSYLPPEDGLSYPLTVHADARGSFTEVLRTKSCGQVSVNVSRPGVTKGQHWHHTKNEKFLVVSGRGAIRFRKPDETKVYTYFVSGDKPEVVDIPPGYTHSIENLGDTDMVTLMWCSECFDPTRPDTYALEV